MSYNLQQTDTASSNAPLCSGRSPAFGRNNCQMSQGGTAGTVNDPITINAIAITPLYAYTMMSATNEPGLTAWAGGDWVVRIRHATGDNDVQLDEIHICRLDASGASLGTVTNRTSLGLTATGGVTREVTFTNVGSVSAAVTNRIGIVFSYVNSSSQANLNVIPNQIVETPVFSPQEMNGTSA